MVDLLALALAGHLLGDWVVQTDRQAACKVWPQAMPALDPFAPRFAAQARAEVRRWRLRTWRANQAHVATCHATLAILIGPWRHDRWALVALAVSWLSHSVIDRRWPVRWLMRSTGSAAFAEQTWGVLAVDQALHLSILALLVAWR